MPKPENLDLDRTNLAYLTVELDNTHPVPVSWGSQDTSTGYARVLIDLGTKEIHKMEMVVDGIFATGDPSTDNLLQDNVSSVQPFHFHNEPQGGPRFFVQQLFDYDTETDEISTASLNNTETGFRFAIDETYALRDPLNGADRAEFVVPDILSGVSYLGLHTADLPVPATAIAGQIYAFGVGSLDGDLLWFGDDGDVGIGSKGNDLLSMGGGNDFALGKAGDDVLDGGSGDDRLVGQKGDDTLWGGDGDDDLSGDSGNDVLSGNRGEDVLDGGAGNDFLTGGEDADMFVFKRFSGIDTITDFEIGIDSLNFTGGQRVLGAELADLDGDGAADDTSITLIGGQISVLGVDLTDSGWL